MQGETMVAGGGTVETGKLSMETFSEVGKVEMFIRLVPLQQAETKQTGLKIRY
jgi:hypothetical protein